MPVKQVRKKQKKAGEHLAATKLTSAERVIVDEAMKTSAAKVKNLEQEFVAEMTQFNVQAMNEGGLLTNDSSENVTIARLDDPASVPELRYDEPKFATKAMKKNPKTA